MRSKFNYLCYQSLGDTLLKNILRDGGSGRMLYCYQKSRFPQSLRSLIFRCAPKYFTKKSEPTRFKKKNEYRGDFLRPAWVLLLLR
jgi:hypothetical protein